MVREAKFWRRWENSRESQFKNSLEEDLWWEKPSSREEGRIQENGSEWVNIHNICGMSEAHAVRITEILLGPIGLEIGTE